MRNATYRVINKNRNWTIDENGIIKSKIASTVPASIVVQVQVQIPETKPVETAEETAEHKITIVNEDGTIDIKIMDRIHDLNRRKKNFVEELSAAEFIRNNMIEKGFYEAISEYMQYSGYKYDGKVLNYQSFISKINDFNAACDVIKKEKQEIEKLDKELEKYEF